MCIKHRITSSTSASLRKENEMKKTGNKARKKEKKTLFGLRERLSNSILCNHNVAEGKKL